MKGKEFILTDLSISIIVSALIDAKTEAKKNNKNGTEDIYIEIIEKTLKDLQEQDI